MKLLITVFIIICIQSVASAQTTQTLTEFLSTPFDLQKFKKAKGQSNSSGGGGKDYWYKPNVKGIYYNFYAFPTEKTCYSYNKGEKFRGIYNNPFGIIIDTYKPFGKYEKDYLDPTETLVSLVASQNDDALPELAFIGLDTTALKAKLPFEFTRFDKCFAYFTDNNLLVAGYNGGQTISWIKYIKLNFNVMKNNIPEELLKYN